ncbi:preprotein translocase subunit SecE [Thiotrichales bacterium 19S11-10]|nr:preprotein translocase subunit SecE [Thiotrichales bacterium 19S11-10]
MKSNQLKNHAAEHSTAKSSEKTKNGLLWTIILFLLGVGIVLNSFYADAVALPLRIAGFIVLVVFLMAASLLTSQGKSAWQFVQSARSEMRRVVWPTRQETVQTTFLIIGVVLVAALIMWLFDSLFIYIVKLAIAV